MFDKLLLLVIYLLIPMSIWIGGLYMWQKCPNNINKLIGFRTTLSMKNIEAWNYANEKAGKIWTVMGMVLTLITVLIYALFWNNSIELISFISIILSLAELAAIFISIFITEASLRKAFDKNGNKI